MAASTIDGTIVDLLSNSNLLQVVVRVNNTDGKQQNDKLRKLQPEPLVRMYSNARIKDRLFPSAVVVTDGAVIEFEILSQGPVGFGYSILSGRNIADRLYCLSPPTESGFRSDTLRRFQSSGELIVIDAASHYVDESHDPRDLLPFWSCDVVTWRVHQFLDPITGVVHVAKPNRTESHMVSAAGVVRSAVISGHGQSRQDFPVIKNVKEDDPETERQAFLNITFFGRGL